MSGDSVVNVLDKGFVRLISHMGSDLTVVNAARVSFAKEKITFETDALTEARTGSPKGSDEALIRYLILHEHFTPFCHPQITLHIKFPIFVARQFMRSNVGIAYNEVSRRYVDTPPEYFYPDGGLWRLRAKNVKQGSSDQSVLLSSVGEYGEGIEGDDEDRVRTLQSETDLLYKEMVQAEIAPELARVVLPQSTYTELWATMSLAAAFRIYRLRIDSHAQFEIQEYARAIGELIEPLFPHSWKYFVKFEKERQAALQIIEHCRKMGIDVLNTDLASLLKSVTVK